MGRPQPLADCRLLEGKLPNWIWSPGALGQCLVSGAGSENVCDTNERKVSSSCDQERENSEKGLGSHPSSTLPRGALNLSESASSPRGQKGCPHTGVGVLISGPRIPFTAKSLTPGTEPHTAELTEHLNPRVARAGTPRTTHTEHGSQAAWFKVLPPHQLAKC